MKDVLYCSKSKLLKDKKVVLCITGSIAAVETVKLARELRRHGATVHAAMSQAAQTIITPLALEFATGNPVVTSITGKVEHVALAGDVEGKADCILVCPCTLSSMGKMASGIADTPPTLMVATGMSHIPVLVVPTMHGSMAKSPFADAIRNRLADGGITVVRGTADEGKLKMPPIERIIKEVSAAVSPKDFAGMRAIVTAGATREPIDGIRHITNRSTGKMGAAVAWELHRRGAEVTVIAGISVSEELPGTVVRADTHEDVRKELFLRPDGDIYVMAMAVSDFSVERSEGKLCSSSEHVLHLKPHAKILPELRERTGGIVVGFKAAHGVEEKKLVDIARDMCSGYGIDLVVANDVGRPLRGFGTDTNEVFIVGNLGIYHHVPLKSKSEVARHIVDAIGTCRGAHGL
jgi:phosphopantothenoylcysteine decarboxylase/phosphopantothenate--cysteine ligase